MRELAVIIRWTEDDIADELRVVTHVINLSSMQVLARMLQQGAEQLDKSTGKKPKDSETPEGRPVNPDGQGGPPSQLPPHSLPGSSGGFSGQRGGG